MCLHQEAAEELAHLERGAVQWPDRLGYVPAGGGERHCQPALDLADVRVSREGLLVTLRRSTTEQEGRGRRVARPRGADPATCPVRVYQTWTAAAGLTGGPLFRKLNRTRQPTARAVSPAYVARLVKRAAAAAGLDPTHDVKCHAHCRHSGHDHCRVGMTRVTG